MGAKCVGPDFVVGTCRDINACPLILNKLLANGTADDVNEYIKDSEEICAYIDSHVGTIINSIINLFNIKKMFSLSDMLPNGKSTGNN